MILSIRLRSLAFHPLKTWGSSRPRFLNFNSDTVNLEKKQTNKILPAKENKILGTGCNHHYSDLNRRKISRETVRGNWPNLHCPVLLFDHLAIGFLIKALKA